VGTAFPGIASKIQSAIGSAETVGFDAIEASIPRNCSLGTKKFCVGFSNRKPSCDNLPFNISKIIAAIPTEVANLLENEIEALQALEPLEGILAKITAARISLIFGLLSLPALAVLFGCVVFGQLFEKFILRLAICLCVLLCVISFASTTSIFLNIQSKVRDIIFNLMPYIRFEEGKIKVLSITSVPACRNALRNETNP
jgi:hypothetical protein